MADNYIGWKMFDTVTIVSRPITKWNYETHENIATGECQGFLVDPKNKKQLDSALSWGTSYQYEYTTNEEGQKVCIDKHEVKPEQHTYDNKGFTLELSEAAKQIIADLESKGFVNSDIAAIGTMIKETIDSRYPGYVSPLDRLRKKFPDLNI